MFGMQLHLENISIKVVGPRSISQEQRCQTSITLYTFAGGPPLKGGLVRNYCTASDINSLMILRCFFCFLALILWRMQRCVCMWNLMSLRCSVKSL